MTIQVQSENRKALVKAISEHLGQEQHYDGPPSFNYRVGAVTITRDCSLIGEQEDLEALKPFLEERGYPVSECLEDSAEQQCAEPEPQSTEPEQIQEPAPEPQSIEAVPIQEPEAEPQSTEPEQIQESEPETRPEEPEAVETETESDIQKISITHTSAELTVASLTNLIFMLYSKQYLLGKALGQQTIQYGSKLKVGVRSRKKGDKANPNRYNESARINSLGGITLSQGNYTSELLGLEGVEIEEFWESDSEIRIFFWMQRMAQSCPRCHVQSQRVHDYRMRTIRDLELRGKHLVLCYNRRRYVCPECGKRFAEACPSAGRYQRFAHQVTLKIMDLLHRRSSIKDIASLTGNLCQWRPALPQIHACDAPLATPSRHLL